MCLRRIPIDSLYDRYQRLAKTLPKRGRWLALVLAPLGVTLSVLVAGLITVIAGITVTISVGYVTSGGNTPISVVWLLVMAFLAESFGRVVKERQELILTVVVRQLTYRRFRSVFARNLPTLEARGHVLTHPGQISQFAYVVDSVVSTVQIVAFLVISLWMYGVGGAIAVLIILGLLFASVRLIILVGRLWERYVSLEGERRNWISRVANALPRGRAIPSWNSALHEITGIRSKEEHLLRKRVLIQVMNGFIDRSALTVTLAVVAILGSWLWPNASFGIGIILAARYLYAAVQNNLINYRVIRLATPMMRELDGLEAQEIAEDRAAQVIDPPSQTVEVLESTSSRARLLRSSLTASNCAFVPSNPQLSQVVLSAWRDSATPRELSLFDSLASAMGLSEDAAGRFWTDVVTLSSGERHRAAVALVLAEEPEWIILDDTFAALDHTTRDIVAKVILANASVCTILTSSEEYVPIDLAHASNTEPLVHDSQVFASQENQAQGNQAQENQADAQEMSQQGDLPDPQTKHATFRRSIGLSFGLHVIWIILGAILLAGSEVGFALVVAGADTLSSKTAYAAGACALGAILGSVIFFGSIYRVPIARLSELHKRIIFRIDKFASPQTSGAVVGRIGEDFSDLQMSVPSAVGSVFIVITQTILLIAGAVAGAPLFISVVIAVAPLAVLAMRMGKKRIMPASTESANRRGEFLGAVGVQAALHESPVSTGLRHAGEAAYKRSESAYLQASIKHTNAYTYRSILIQLLVLVLNISAVVLASMFGSSNPLVEPAAVIFFAVTLSAGIESTVATLQEVGMLGLTTERVRLLADFEAERSAPPLRTDALNQLEKALASGVTLVALIGRTGAGKSVILDTLYRQLPEGEVGVIPDVDPFASEKTDLSGLTLARLESRDGSARLILLDETIKNLTPQQERAELESLAEVLEHGGKQAVVVLHSRSNLDCFSMVVNLDE